MKVTIKNEVSNFDYSVLNEIIKEIRTSEKYKNNGVYVLEQAGKRIAVKPYKIKENISLRISYI